MTELAGGDTFHLESEEKLDQKQIKKKDIIIVRNPYIANVMNSSQVIWFNTESSSYSVCWVVKTYKQSRTSTSCKEIPRDLDVQLKWF